MHGVRWGGGFERVFVYTVCMRVRVRVHVCVRAPYGVCACGGGTLRAGMLMRE